MEKTQKITQMWLLKFLNDITTKVIVGIIVALIIALLTSQWTALKAWLIGWLTSAIWLWLAISMAIIVGLIVWFLTKRSSKKSESQLPQNRKSSPEVKKAINEINVQLADTNKAMLAYVRDHSEDLESEQRKGALAQVAKLREAVNINKLYFDKPNCDLLDNLVSIYSRIDVSKSIAAELKNSANQTGNSEEAKESNKILKEIWDDFHDKIPELEQKLRKRFQQLLGIQS